MDYGWQHHIGIQTWVSHTIPVWDFRLRTLPRYMTHSVGDGEGDMFYLQTTTFTTQVHSHTCPTTFRVPCLGTNRMRHANRDISNAPSVHSAAIIEEDGRAANLVTKASWWHAHMRRQTCKKTTRTTTATLPQDKTHKGALTSKGDRSKHLESRFTSTKFYCYQ